MAQRSSIIEGVTDAKWLQFMDAYAFKIEGIQEKIPLLARELGLSLDDQQAVKDLFADHEDEKLMSRVATSPGIRGSSQDGSLDKVQSKEKQKNYMAMEDEAADGPSETLKQVGFVRGRLGSRDEDFRFWFYVEKFIDQEENKVYHHDQNYSVDQLSETLFKEIVRTQEFKDFKARKMTSFQSAGKVAAYLSGWRSSIQERVLLQKRIAKR